MLMSDRMIRQAAYMQGMITPFVDRQVNTHRVCLICKRETPVFDLGEYYNSCDCGNNKAFASKRVISYGLGSYTYDIRMGYQIGIPKPTIFDLKNASREHFEWRDQTTPFIIRAQGAVLTVALETIKVPRNILVECISKSSWARQFTCQLVTPLEPEWYGNPTLEIVNLNEFPVTLYPGEGIAALKFQVAVEECEVSYADRNNGKGGRYQGDMGIEVGKA